MRRILYIGNKLNNNSSNVSSINILGGLFEKEGYKLSYASSKNNKILRLLDMLYTTFKLRHTTDVVVIDTYSTLNFYYALLMSQLCRLLKIKYIHRLNGGNLPMRLERNPLYSKWMFNQAFQLVSPSTYLEKAFKDEGYSNVVYIPNSIEIDEYSYTERAFDSIRLFWVRSFSKIYNPALAIQVLKRLQMEGHAASLCMVGPDSDGSLNQAKALAEELDVEVTFTGKLTKHEWYELSNKYNLFINTTDFDNMPVSVVEAMALGLPIISTNVGGIPYLIEHEKDGLLVPPNDVDAFVLAIKKLYKQPVFAKTLAFNARKKAEGFDWSVVKIKWHNIFGN